jgi:hypothetical protein
MNDIAQFQPAFNGVNTLLAGNLKLKGNISFLLHLNPTSKLSISLHRYYKIYLLVLLSTWTNITVHVNLTSSHPGAEVSTEIAPQR